MPVLGEAARSLQLRGREMRRQRRERGKAAAEAEGFSAEVRRQNARRAAPPGAALRIAYQTYLPTLDSKCVKTSQLPTFFDVFHRFG